MSLQNMGLAALTVFVLAACGGGGSSGPSTASMPTQNPGNTETPENNGGQSSVSDAEVKATKTLSVATLKSINEDALREEFGAYGFRTINNYQVTVNGKRYSNGNIDLSSLGNGMKRVPVVESGRTTIGGSVYTANLNSTAHLYQQPYSVVAGMMFNNGQLSGPGLNQRLSGGSYLIVDTVKGYSTKVLPTEGKYTYNGAAFTDKGTGDLSYSVDFSSKTGSGRISGIREAGIITLDEGKIGRMSHNNPDKTTINGLGIESTAHSTVMGRGAYQLGFFGPNAEEIAGAVMQNGEGLVGFGGKR
ncbi:factor H binding protein domain-containing protein [Uruburuella suis]|jgi:hypothetical protein|uniref:factor H binding protein domain-containing protein n=1 Tax=Uruburuella suis TaxID=252130 RepID=UPI001B5F8D8B|nr:factor H binding protein domain-containing protein [Uruburuella suis]MBP8875726.1 hypothetical protein [Neisseria sp.]